MPAENAMIRPIWRLPPSRFRTPALISSILVLPFLVLEWVNRRSYPEGFPILLFALLWLLPFLFLRMLSLILGSTSAEGCKAVPLPHVLARGAALALLLWLWVSLLHDQLPCFLGVPNCD